MIEIINLCKSFNSHVVLDNLNLNIETGETTPDFRFTLETVNCVGACALGPIVMINGKYHGQMTPHKVDALLKSYT